MDGDRDVDFLDLYAFNKAYQTNAGGPNYSAALDVEGDGNVGASDLVSFREHYLTVLQGLPRVVAAP